MKIASLLLALSLHAAPIFAQDVTVETPKEATEQAAERQRKLQAKEEERAKALLEKKAVTYSGYLHDLSRAEKKSHFFSLRQPRDPKNDVKNISFDERSGRPRGFALFRLEF
ncbi:MAG: hypothetical protein ACXW3L_02425 [Limisphaerales bacterium]